MRIFATLAVILSLTSLAQAAERQYLIKFKIGQGKVNAKADDPTTKILSGAQLLLLSGRTGVVKTGAEILLPDFGTKTVEHAETSIHAEVNCRRADDESV